MKPNPWRWLWGIVPIAMLCWIAVLSERERIEIDLRAKAQAAFEAAGLPWAAASFYGRDAILTGQATEEGEPDKAHALLADTWGVRIVDNRAELIEKASIYQWAATQRDNRVRLTGNVPNEPSRRAIIGIAKANFPRSEIEDRMKAARGVPSRDIWLTGVSFGLKTLAQLKSGSVELEGTNLSATGVADDIASYKSIKSALSGGLPQGISLKADRVTAPVVSPYTWFARLAANQVVLSGYVPGEQQRNQLYNIAKAAFPRLAIIDRMEIGDGAPEAWTPATAAAVRELARLEEGAAELRANLMTVSGMASDDVIADAVRKSLRERMPASFRLVEAIKFKAPAVPTFNPFRTLAEVTTTVAVLSGHVPSEAAKTALNETARARLPGRRIDDRLQVGNGAPAGWQSCIQSALAGLGRLGAGRAEIINRRLQVRGDTTDPALHKSLAGEIELAAAQSCDVAVDVALREPPEPDLHWKATRSGRQVVIEGQVPDAAIKAALAQKARQIFAGDTVVDQTSIAIVPPGRWLQVAEAGLEELTRLRVGSAEISGHQLTVTGEVSERAVASSIRDRVTQQLAKGYSGREEIAVRTDAEIAAEAAKRRSEDEARRRQETAALEAARRRDQEEAAARRKAEQEAAEASRRRSEQEAAEAARRKTQDEGQRKVEIDRCQTTLHSVLKAGVIQFERASADLSDKSYATLAELAKALKACPNVTIEIEGHTDIEGAPDRNQRLSERRASSVLDHLVARGIDSSRLVAIGYGQDRPVATNDTSDGRAKNRRIEFTVKDK